VSAGAADVVDAVVCVTCGQSVGVVVITPVGLQAARLGLQPLRVIEAHGTCPATTLPVPGRRR
jgi:hypothetical protein